MGELISLFLFFFHFISWSYGQRKYHLGGFSIVTSKSRYFKGDLDNIYSLFLLI